MHPRTLLTNRRKVLAPLSLLLGAVAIAGCHGTTSSSATTTSTSPSVTTTTVPVTYVNTIPLRQNISLSSCQATKGGWRASGTARNPGNTARTYRLTVYFTNSQATVLGSGTSSATIAAKGSGPWSVTTTFHAPSVVRCVLVGVG